jgi:hypothetical protein
VAQPAEPREDESPDYAREAPTLAPLYELFRAIARRVAAEKSGSEAKPTP